MKIKKAIQFKPLELGRNIEYTLPIPVSINTESTELIVDAPAFDPKVHNIDITFYFRRVGQSFEKTILLNPGETRFKLHDQSLNNPGDFLLIRVKATQSVIIALSIENEQLYTME